MTSTRREAFGQTPDGEPVERITLTNRGGASLSAITYGATITALTMPDRDGALGDVVLGHDALDGYLADTAYLGAAIGRVAGRIANGRFVLGGRTFDVARNSGPNHLHGGDLGFDKVVWTAQTFAAPAATGVTFRRVSPDGEEGYPGALRVAITYALTDDDEVRIGYEATTDARTPVNLTQHTYFNLAGAGDILGHELTIPADRFLVVDETLVPTSERRSVRGTAFDFTAPHAIGERIDERDAQLRNGHGYDHCFVLTSSGTDLTRAAFVRDPASGRTLEVSTTEPGVQFYSGNFLDGTRTGKGGMVHEPRSGFCVETQHFPDAPNQPSFPSIILAPGRTLRSRTVWRFRTEES